MSEAVLDAAIEQIADGATVDWSAVDKGAPAREREWAKSLRVLNDIVKLHREAAVDFEQTTLARDTPASRSTDASSDTWGKYRLANKVGEGSYGSVYRAWDSELERDVAIKILHRRVGDMRLKERLLQEGRALAKIRHNNVVNVHGVEAHADRVGLCMEFVRGKTLADIVLSQGKMSAAEAVLIGEDLCRALSAVHRAGYIHRDVKAKNVMRDDTGRIVLMDFGTGRTTEPQEGKSDRAGTPLYMAPEVLEGGQASARSDVYSLGVLLYHLVTGDYPVHARSVDDLRDAHAHRQHRWLSELRPDLPVAFMQVVERAIALDPAERYANASELLAALGSLKIGTHPIVVRMFGWASAAGVVVLGIFALGALTSAVFNVALERSDFAAEDILDYLDWGRRTSLPPFLVLIMVLLTISALVVLRRPIVASSGRARDMDAAFRRKAAAIVHRLRLNEAPILASYALLVSTVALAVAWVYFAPLMLAVISRVSTASVDNLTLLSRRYVTYHNYYRGVFSAVVMIAVGSWYPVWRLTKKGQSVHWGMVAGGTLVAMVAMGLLHFPHRLLYFNKSFEAVSWNNMRCYTIGQRADDLLLFCPASQPPRNRVVKADDRSLVPLNVRESIFTYFAEQP
jgi:RIO-like serine/threonine protein kinase